MAEREPKRRQLEHLCASLIEVHIELRTRYQLDRNEWAERGIREWYRRGNRAEASVQVLRWLEEKCGSQARMAEFLGVERTAISKMKSSKSVSAPYLALAIASEEFDFNRESMTRMGLIEAAYYVRRHVQRDDSCGGPMTERECLQLLSGEQNDWYEPFVLALMEVQDLVGKRQGDAKYR